MALRQVPVFNIIQKTQRKHNIHWPRRFGQIHLNRQPSQIAKISRLAINPTQQTRRQTKQHVSILTGWNFRY